MVEETVEDENQQSEDSVQQTIQERVKELEQSLAERETEAVTLKQTIGVLEQKFGQAVASYKTVIMQANPEITPELVTGNSIQLIDESLEKAKSLVGKVRKSVEKEMSRTRIPIGSPGRRPSDVSALSPREKIQYGIGGKQ